jgi:hypothetical protein
MSLADALPVEARSVTKLARSVNARQHRRWYRHSTAFNFNSRDSPMRAFSTTILLTSLALSTVASAQPTDRGERREQGMYLTMFRSPATGVEFRAGHAAAFVGHYPTVISRDGMRGNANFVRAGVTYYAKSQGTSAYVSPSVMWSLGSKWRSGALTELGFRGKLYGRLNGRLGAAVLTTLDKQVRVNPTVGFDLKLGAGR